MVTGSGDLEAGSSACHRKHLESLETHRPAETPLRIKTLQSRELIITWDGRRIAPIVFIIRRWRHNDCATAGGANACAADRGHLDRHRNRLSVHRVTAAIPSYRRASCDKTAGRRRDDASVVGYHVAVLKLATYNCRLQSCHVTDVTLMRDER
ncbi:hypothetical protein EVAR_27112_1 [Eumeta japonica]|uniref:Uncharacterized protein n=1 Tax=Eumeta variegata TaxID=151549 RepID=A0A4C1VL69_EUMVA|nr:hypothetical protein EVAR_27112_1 [Eumeta japonica]